MRALPWTNKSPLGRYFPPMLSHYRQILRNPHLAFDNWHATAIYNLPLSCPYQIFLPASLLILQRWGILKLSEAQLPCRPLQQGQQIRSTIWCFDMYQIRILNQLAQPRFEILTRRIDTRCSYVSIGTRFRTQRRHHCNKRPTKKVPDGCWSNLKSFNPVAANTQLLSNEIDSFFTTCVVCST